MRDDKRFLLDLQFEKDEYKLTNDTNYQNWNDKVKTALQSNGVLFTIDANKPIPPRYTKLDKNEFDQVQMKVRSYILAHLDEEHHSIIANLDEPKEIMQILEKKNNPKGRTALLKAKREFALLKHNWNKETASNFIHRFERLVTQIQQCGCGVNELLEELIRNALLIAIQNDWKDVGLYLASSIGPNRPNLTVREIKERMLEEEQRYKEIGEQKRSTDSTMNAYRLKRLDRKKKYELNEKMERICLNCRDYGHSAKYCKTNKQRCYECLQLTDHIAANCPIQITRLGENEQTKTMYKQKQRQPRIRWRSPIAETKTIRDTRTRSPSFERTDQKSKDQRARLMTKDVALQRM
jgi:hypothetical protein